MSCMQRVVVKAAVVMTLVATWGGRLASAQPLVDKVPADALVYLGWAGSEQMPGYEGSHLKAVLDGSDAPKLFTESLPMLVEKLQASDRAAAEKLRAVLALAGPMWKHPTAMYVLGMDFS